MSRDGAPLNSSGFLILARSWYRGDISAIIPGSVAEHVKREMEAWARRWDTPKFVGKLERALDRNNGSIEKAKVQLENS